MRLWTWFQVDWCQVQMQGTVETGRRYPPWEKATDCEGSEIEYYGSNVCFLQNSCLNLIPITTLRSGALRGLGCDLSIISGLGPHKSAWGSRCIPLLPLYR